ncbi:MAG: response regulator transcription factor [Myxococcota bacterium]
MEQMSAAGASTTHRILLVDDHPIVRKGLRSLVDSEPDLKVCAEASCADEALQVMDEELPDLAIVDVTLKSRSGIELTRQLRARHPDLPILVLSFHDETLYAQRALNAGARGYIMKDEATTRLHEAIRRVLHGRIYLSDAMTERLLEQAGAGVDAPEESPVERLSDRELEVFEKIGAGLGTRAIAEQLHLSIKTIESYRANIKQKLQLGNAAELVQQAVLWVETRH